MPRASFDDFRSSRAIPEHHLPGEVAKTAFIRIGESADGSTVRDYLQSVVSSQSASFQHEDLIGHEARRRFASELLHLMEPKRVKPKKQKPSS